MSLTIRLPVAPHVDAAGAPAFTVDGPITGTRVGLRTDLAWRSWMLIAARWDEYLQRDGASTLAIQTAAQVGKEGADDRATVDALVRARRLRDRRSRHVRVVHVVQRPRRGRARAARKPSVVVVCSEFETHARNMARFLGHPDLKVLVLPYPLEARPDDELLQIADEYYPQALELLGATT